MKYIEECLTILKNTNTTTTYKVAWARAIAELAVSKKDIMNSTIKIYFSEIAYKFLSDTMKKVDETIIERLNQRNLELLNVIQDKKEYNNLKEEIENNYLGKLYSKFRY